MSNRKQSVILTTLDKASQKDELKAQIKEAKEHVKIAKLNVKAAERDVASYVKELQEHEKWLLGLTTRLGELK